MVKSNKIIAGICLSKPTPGFITGIMRLAHSRILFGWSVANISLLPFVRNNAIEAAYREESDFTHLLFIDDDMSEFTEDHVLQLLEADKSIISGLIVSRLAPYRILSQLTDETPEQIKWHIEHQSILKEKHVGMAFTLIKREVLDTMQQPYPGGRVWFTMDRSQRVGFADECMNLIKNTELDVTEKIKEAVLLGLTAHIGTELIGEDVEFCRRAAAFGFGAYTHCGIIIGHAGFTVRDHVEYKIRKDFEDEKPSNNPLKLVLSE